MFEVLRLEEASQDSVLLRGLQLVERGIANRDFAGFKPAKGVLNVSFGRQERENLVNNGVFDQFLLLKQGHKDVKHGML